MDGSRAILSARTVSEASEMGPLRPAAGNIPFRDRERAAQNLARVSAGVPAGMAQALPPLLLESPDPDAALNGFERLLGSAGPELVRLLDRHRVLIHYALAVFGYSHFLSETLIQNSDLFPAFLREKNLERTHSREEFHEALARFRSRSFETDTALLLARFKRREYVRIMLRDLLGIATLAETTAEISALADVLIEEALRVCDSGLRKRYGAPQHRDAAGRLVDAPFSVLSLGKLGGNELNYSSDIDLLYLYGDGEDAETASISNREYFIRLGQQITGLLSRVTPDGAAFRIDLRLRPQGGEGEPAVGLGHALQYYARAAGDWELQAMLKLRHSAGDVALSRAFIRGVQPYIYGTSTAEQASRSLTPVNRLNFEAIETALDARDRMLQRRRRAAARGVARSLDVKLDRGGIRDIEFLVQCLQRVYGGAETWLRSGGTMFSLQKLHDKGHITGKEFHELSTAYEFLRKVEHRLQLRTGQQTHRLPESPDEVRVLYRSIEGDESGQYSPDGMVALVRMRMWSVAGIYERIIHHQQLQQQREAANADLQLGSSLFAPGREATEAQVLERLAADTPELYDVIRSADLPLAARRNLNRFLTAAFTSSERYATVARSPRAVGRGLQLFGVSEYLTDILLHHPQEITALEQAVEPPPGRGAELFSAPAETGAASDPVFEYLGSSSAPYGDKLSLLRQHFRHRIFRSGARDIMELRQVYESLAENTAAADAAIAAAFAIAGKPEGFAVLTLGRLGTREFDLLSDADLIFLRDERLEARAAARAAEIIVEALAAYTRDGTVFPVDTRLRPRGAEGELVITPAYLNSYVMTEAQAWEALTYTKLRLLAGSTELGEQARRAAEALANRFAADGSFTRAAREMRSRLERSDSSSRNLKTAAGGLYDIDFIIGYLLVRHGIEATRGNFRERLRGLVSRDLLPADDAELLDRAAEFLRTLEHLVRIVTGRARKTLPLAGGARQAVEELAAKILRREFPEGLEGELDQTFRCVRRIYETQVTAGS